MIDCWRIYIPKISGRIATWTSGVAFEALPEGEKSRKPFLEKSWVEAQKNQKQFLEESEKEFPKESQKEFLQESRKQIPDEFRKE